MSVGEASKERRGTMQQAKVYLKEFSSETGLQGFSFVNYSICYTERVIWIVIIIAFFFLTCNDLYKTISEYLEGKTSTVATVNNNQTIAFNDTTFCFKIDTDKLPFGVDLRKPEQTKALLAKFNKTHDIIGYLSNELNGTIGEIKDKELKQLVMITASMLASIVKLENVNSYKNFTEVDGLWGISVKNGASFKVDKSTSETFALVYNFYIKKSTDFSLLLKLIAKFLVAHTYATADCVKV